MLRLDQHYFRALNPLFFGTFILLAVMGYFLLRQVEIDNHRTMLHNLMVQFRITGSHPIDAFQFKVMHDQSGVRITFIDRKGVVIHETNRDPVGMENHLNRPEIRQARAQGWGSAVRYSHTLERDMLYVAQRLENGYLRMAYPLSTIREKYFGYWLQALALFALAFGGALWWTLRINRSVNQDVLHITMGLDNLLERRYDEAAPTIQCCRELHVIAHQIGKVAARLKKRDRQKSKYTKKLKRLTQQQSEIISAISHEFKNPVAAIIGYAQTVYDDPKLTPELRKRFLSKVIANSQRISDMIDRLSLAIKFENHALDAKKESFDLAILLGEITENLQQKYPQRTINVVSTSVPVRADKMMLGQVLGNLIDNALKYSELEVAVYLDSEQFYVSDYGNGIEPDALPHVTQRFFRTNTRSWDNSIGVGLFIVEYVLRLHHTQLTIASRFGEGSTFGFSLSALRA